MEPAIFMIEGGKALAMVREHIAERLRVRAAVKEMVDELGVENFFTNRLTDVLTGIDLKGTAHPEFTKAKGFKGVSVPKKGTEWDKRFKAQAGVREANKWIVDEFDIPCCLHYKNTDCHGSKRIGTLFNECGFLYFGENGPFAMWTPDVPAEVAAMVADGYEVEEPANSFVLDFDGCRRIEKEEWQILALQNALEERKAAQQNQ